MSRYRSKTTLIGNLPLGGGHPVRLQSMTNTPTAHVRATTDQAIRIFEAGADLARIAVPDKESALALPLIRSELLKAGFHHPLVADIHYLPELALLAAPHVEKIRINPGNYPASQKGEQALKTLAGICHDSGTAIRVGTNLASLPTKILKRFQQPAEAMAEETFAFLQQLEGLGFHRIVVSMKASDSTTMIDACLLLTKKMQANQMCYPMHVGVTEAGNGLSARIRAAVGIGTLLKMGIGDTIRVSLTEDPVNEIAAARKIVTYAQQASKRKEVPSYEYRYETSNPEDLAIMAAIDISEKLLGYRAGKMVSDSRKADSTSLLADHFKITSPAIHNESLLASIRQWVLQSAGRPSLKTEFIGCPSCSRATANMEALLNAVKERLGDIAGLKIAVMGCVVNGPGEMRDAHYGLMAASDDTIWLYKGSKIIKKGITTDVAPSALMSLLKKDGWISTAF